jgi:nitroreductase
MSAAGGAWRELIETATRAPSPHNVQPWRFRIADDAHAELLIEKRRTLPNEDVQGSFILMTMGIIVEALDLVAAHRGLAVEAEAVADLATFTADAIRAREEPLLPFARLTLRPAPERAAEYPLALFAQRRTSRLPYHPDPVPAAVSERLAATAAAAGQRYAQTLDAPRIERLLALNIEAVIEDLNHPPYRDELRGWLRYSEGSSRRHRDGLDARCMHASPVELWTAFHASALMRMPGIGVVFRRRYRRQIGPVATMGFLCGPFWDPHEAYPAGRFLIRFWLEVTRAGLYLHPYGNLVTHRPTAARVEAETGLSNVWLAFKIGRSDAPPPSRRRDVTEVLA